MVTTWHHGLVARWWAEFNHGGDDIEVFAALAEKIGGPVLDAGCGTGRLLVPMLESGIDADGSDAAPDMLTLCGEALAVRGLQCRLYPQAMHELDLERAYRTILICGAFGLGGSRADDLEGLRRVRHALQAGGALVMDHYLPNFESSKSWDAWIQAPQFPRPWPQDGERRTASDGTDLRIRQRQVAFDPLDQSTTLEIRVDRFVDDTLAESEAYCIDINLYFKHEVELMLRTAGFDDVTVTSFDHGGTAQPWRDRRLLFVARS